MSDEVKAMAERLEIAAQAEDHAARIDPQGAAGFRQHATLLRSAASMLEEMERHSYEREVAQQAANQFKHIAEQFSVRLRSLEEQNEKRAALFVCKTHPDVNANLMWGCPDCLAELRRENEKLREALGEAIAYADAAALVEGMPQGKQCARLTVGDYGNAKVWDVSRARALLSPASGDGGGE